MRSSVLVLLSLALVAVAPAHAQEESEECTVGQLEMASSSSSTASTNGRTDSSAMPTTRAAVTEPRPAVSVSPATEAESFVQDRIEKDGLHVVHFWAPWCSNSRNELGNGWAGLVADNPNVTFTFVTVWNDDKSGTATLNDYNLPGRVVEVTQPDLGPSDEEANRRYSFLGLPVTWIPSTWIFHSNGELAFAMNYGEMEMETVQRLLDATSADW
ncbi:TlpA family protein disulfide reductase [Salinibacter grassmerensis]|uniref:TlpA family protein disulfide reductase n=1 Tax=Salinibacter grassmerensis TaxID=3040353 RepID=UPI0021E89D54|nr:thioredoxin [Salinibacter grassmerensis]